MRIIDKNNRKDYYDSIMKYGVSDDLIYIRSKKEEVLKEWPFPKTRWGMPKCPDGAVVIGFCGKVYPAILKSPDIYKVQPSLYWCYSIEDIDKFVEKHYTEKQKRCYYGVGRHRNTAIWTYDWDSRDSFKEMFELFDKHQNNYSFLFDKFKSPIFTIVCSHINIRKSHNVFNVNDFLNQFDFQKIKDPYTAFQEIAMWLSNQACPEKPIPKMTNEENAARLGHGGKYSFRKGPSI